VHRAAFALAATGDFTEKLGHYLLAAEATGQGLTMVSVVSDNIIVGSQGGYGAHGDSFLATIKVQETPDIASGILTCTLSFELSNEAHLPIEFQQL